MRRSHRAGVNSEKTVTPHVNSARSVATQLNNEQIDSKQFDNERSDFRVKTKRTKLLLTAPY